MGLFASKEKDGASSQYKSDRIEAAVNKIEAKRETLKISMTLITIVLIGGITAYLCIFIPPNSNTSDLLADYRDEESEEES